VKRKLKTHHEIKVKVDRIKNERGERKLNGENEKKTWIET